MALGDAILACLTERPMTGYELAKTFDASIGFFWKADHQQIYRELSKLRDRGHVQAREVVQSGKPNKLVYTLTPEGRAAFRFRYQLRHISVDIHDLDAEPGRRRQLDRECRPLDLDPAPVLLHDRGDDGQAQAGARAPGRPGPAPEALEQPLAVGAVGARTLIGNRQHRVGRAHDAGARC